MNKKTFSSLLRRAALSGLLAMAASNVSAGNILLTGHDSDAHNAGSFGGWALTYLLNNGNGTSIPTSSTTGPRIGFIGNSSANLANYFGPYDNYFFYDLDLASWTNAFTDNNQVLVIGSGLDFVVSGANGSGKLNAQQAAFTTYFNNGGNLLVHTHQGLGQSYYNFLPAIGNATAANLTTCTSESGSGACMAPTAAGTAAGHTIGQIVQASITHNQFTAYDTNVFDALSYYVPTGNAITIGLVGGQINEGGFQVPSPAPLALLALGLLALLAGRRRIGG